MQASRKPRRIRAILTPLSVLALATSLPLDAAHAQAPDQSAGQVSVSAIHHGPKKTIAVSKFDAVGSFVARYGGWDIGGGLSAMLIDELQRTGRFVVVERADLDTLLREKQMALSNVATGGSGGPLRSAQVFVRGSVTAFDMTQSGGGASVGLNLGRFFGGLGGRKSKGRVEINLRLIDAETGAILTSKTVEADFERSSIAVQARRGRVSVGGDKFDQTPIGEAARGAIVDAVRQIVADMQSVPWQATVVDTDGELVYINAGAQANIRRGTMMRAVRTTRTITDPNTGETLGNEQESVGDLVIERVEDRYAVARWLGHQPAFRGDVVRFLGEANQYASLSNLGVVQ